MKRLSGISPFILLLIPVFIMALFTSVLSVNQTNPAKNEAALKTSASPSINNVLTRLTK